MTADCCMDPRPPGCTAHTVRCLLDNHPTIRAAVKAPGREDEA